MLASELAGTGIPLVFLHAYPLSKCMWSETKKKISQNFRVITVDLPGFGATPLQNSTSTMDDMASELIRTLDELKISEKIILIGVSMGGYVCFSFLRKAAERLRGLVLVSTRAGADSEEGRQGRFRTIGIVEKEGLDPLIETIVPKLLGKTTLAENPSVVEWVRSEIKKANPASVCAALRGMAARLDSTDLLSKISVPTLVVSGEDDAFIASSEMKGMAEKIPGARFELISKAGHLPNLEKSVEFNDVFSHFLKRSVL
jgi:3-oxoadipate enol-lactonase